LTTKLYCQGYWGGNDSDVIDVTKNNMNYFDNDTDDDDDVVVVVVAAVVVLVGWLCEVEVSVVESAMSLFDGVTGDDAVAVIV